MICGLAAFGPLGLVAGPLIAALFHAVTKMLNDERQQRAANARKPGEAA
jgi:predicted PurR-regulated permease PerM